MDDKIEVVGHHDFGFGKVPIYRAKEIVKIENTDTLALLTRLVNELKEENEMLRKQLMFADLDSCEIKKETK